jgi:Family of unknown function (DUF6152)
MAEACVSGPDIEETPMKLTAISLAAIAAVAFVAPAFAHHSFAMFDQDKTVTFKGTVKEFEWSNPHVWLRVMVVDQATGKALQYAFEMGSVRRSMLDGWKADSVKPGDTITVTIHPLKDGARGGMYLSAALASGKSFGRTGPAVGLADPQ